MAVIILSTIWLGVGSAAAAAETFLEKVLFVLVGGDPTHVGVGRASVAQTADTIRFLLEVPPLNWSVVVKQIGACKFDVTESGADYGDGKYIVDFQLARFEDLRVAPMRTARGSPMDTLSLPGATFCLEEGISYYNADVKPGSCADHLNIGLISPRNPGGHLRSWVETIIERCNRVSMRRPSSDVYARR
jgi:hypothetical protein